jgi:acyl-CoA thioesterase
MNKEVIIDKMFAEDKFSQWLDIERVEESKGYCRLRMQIRAEMLNGFGIAHGGICYSLADSALAFASNARGRKSVTVDSSLSFFKPVKAGETIYATATEIHSGEHIGHYEVSVENEQGELIAFFKGTVYIRDISW